jgi:IseA DL-endopeptidase inhibitor
MRLRSSGEVGLFILVLGLLGNSILPTEQVEGKAGNVSSNPTETEVVNLVAKAQDNYWYFMGGGQLEPGVIKTYKLAGNDHEYFFYGKDLDTLEEVRAFLETAHTKESVDAFLTDMLKSKSLVVSNGKVARIMADSGSLYVWKESKPFLIEDNGIAKTYKFAVPLGETEVEVKEVHIKYVKGVGWRISDPVGTVR